jgi:LuxR family maltose regulon positive regulatory protein
LEEAIDHALAAKDHNRVIRLIEKNIPLMADGRQTRLPEWIGALPPDLLEKKPLLYLLQAVGLVTQGHIHKAEPLLDEAEKRIAPRDQTVPTRDMRGRIAGLRAHFASMRGDLPSTIDFAELARRNLAPTSRTAKLTTSYTLARAYFTTGEFVKAKEELSYLLPDRGHGSAVPFVYALCTSLTGTILTIEGKLNEALELYREAIRSIEERGAQRFFLGGSTYAGLASVLRERDELREAEQRVEQGITLNRLWGNSSAVVYGLSVRARILIARERPGEAAKALREARGLAEDFELYPEARSNLLRAEVELNLAEGDPETALHLARQQRLVSPEAQVPWREQDKITYASALLAGGRMEEAAILLEILGRAAEKAHRNGPLIAILNLRALVQRIQGRKRAAESFLRKSLELAASQGFTRIFLDQGEDMRELLTGIHRQLHGELQAYADRLLSAFPAL